MTNSRPSRLLIVDDNEMNRDMLARRLVRKGYVVGLADSAKELLERVKEDAVDLVLLDIEMPEISGLDALQKLRQRYSAAELPIIMVTAKAQSDDIVKALVRRQRLFDEADRFSCRGGSHWYSAVTQTSAGGIEGK